ncbi:hypothetical protein LP418_27080 [Nocardioides sp. B-3]|nr:hypothetical protein LP418_27080 [Nocardioides sp. B-3]
MPHDDLGQEVAAVIVSDEPLDAAELCAFAGERLGHFKVPTHWRFTDRPLPATRPAR